MKGNVMDVREIAGACGTLKNIVPTVWRPDPETVCILLDNPKTGRWLVITLGVRGEIAGLAANQQTEVA